MPATRALVRFGSRGRGEARPSSDLAFLPIFCDSQDATTYQALWCQARRRLGVLPVDLDLLVEDEPTALPATRARLLALIRRLRGELEATLAAVVAGNAPAS